MKNINCLNKIILLLSVFSLPWFNIQSIYAESHKMETNGISNTQLPGTLEGVLIGAESHDPLTGAKVVLCKSVTNNMCIFKADYHSIADEDGYFKIHPVPPGSYVLFYGSSDKDFHIWKDIDGSEFYVDVEGFIGRQPARNNLFSTFGGDGAIRIKKGTTFSVEDGVVSAEGGVSSEEYDLNMDFHEGRPLSVEIGEDGFTKVEIKAWGL